MCLYHFRKKNIPSYLQELDHQGLKRSQYLDDHEVEMILDHIGIFRFKGYLYAFRPHIDNHSIDDVLIIYYFDKFLTRFVMEHTSTIETILKTRLVELSYGKTDNPFFYLLDENHKYTDFRINKPSLDNWKHRQSRHHHTSETYSHYALYYQAKYRFETNRTHYLSQQKLIEIRDDVNYPPFHYFVESATLGVVNHLIKSLTIGKYELLWAIGKSFGIHNPKTFKPYLERLNEVRNRAAHRERLFNRSFRSVVGVDRCFRAWRAGIDNHRFADVYLYLFFMLGKLSRYHDYASFRAEEIEKLFEEFQSDRIIAQECFGLNKHINQELKAFLLKNMGA